MPITCQTKRLLPWARAGAGGLGPSLVGWGWGWGWWPEMGLVAWAVAGAGGLSWDQGLGPSWGFRAGS